MADAIKPIKDTCGNLLGYSSCPLCERTAWATSMFGKWHRLSLAQPGSHIMRGWYPMCQNCWDARTPAERWYVIQALLAAQGNPFSVEQNQAIHGQVMSSASAGYLTY